MASTRIIRRSHDHTADRAVDGIADTDIGTARAFALTIASDVSRSDRSGDVPVIAATQRQLAAPLAR